jgi:TRAP transporter TAXI family solute receptor
MVAWRAICWRSLVCASFVFAALLGGAVAAEDARFFRIGTAATAGSFFEIGGIVASAISSPPGTPTCAKPGNCGVPGLVAVAQTTQGSIDNLRMINSAQIESGFAQADLAGWAYAGNNLFSDTGPMPRLRAIASLFPETLHLVVRAESSIRSLADLAGKTVALGEPGSGTNANARVLLAAVHLGEADLTRRYLSPSQAAAALQAGTIDAFFVVGAPPIPAVRELAASVPIRLVAIAPEIVGQLAKEFSFYRPATIAADIYPGITAETPSAGFSALWLVGAGIDSDLVYAITKSLWSDATGRLMAALPAGQRIDFDRALDGLSVPLHPGAERFYREAGRSVDDAPRIKEVEDRTK